MLQYSAINGQSFSDVCLNTYGTLDDYIKMCNDNGISPNNAPYSGQDVTWDETIIADQTIYKKTTGNGIAFATLAGNNNNNYFQIIGGENPTKYAVNPAPIFIGGGGSGGSNMYIKPFATSYTSSTGGETTITVLALQNKQILQVEREIKPLKASEFIFDSVAGTIQLAGIDPLSAGETLFILYTETITI
jgi:hypothetical protein